MKAAICYERNQPVRIEEVILDAPRRVIAICRASWSSATNKVEALRMKRAETH